ncbi:MAG: tRNA lysidine(34) synthetase TilS [Rhodobacteraceae bacterium]|nr:tRNA lysidine(34) synthetase TilS [Paracoccaceae bacterium]
MTQSDADILSAVRAQVGPVPDGRLGIAVSGGGDSVALLHILSRCFNSDDVQLFVATVDHGLRPESSHEAMQVAKLAASLGIEHSTLQWKTWDNSGNLQDHARRARTQLLGDWAKANNISTLLQGHTADDQAETVLMRLGRSAGVDGLAAIPTRRVVNGITIVRPMMGLTRGQLRDYLIRQGIDWADDPSNDDPKYDRVKARQLLDLLEPLGISADSLSDVAQNMASARVALDWYCFLAAQEIACVNGGNVVLDLRKFRTLPDETARRLFVGIFSWISGSDYPPRRVPVLAALASLREGRAATLGGCHVLQYRQTIWLCREYNAVRGAFCEFGQLWDQRWLLTGDNFDGCEVRALGQSGLKYCPNWRDMARPEVALTSSPAVWRGDELIAAPFAGLNNGCTAELVDGSEGFFSSILSH